MVTHFWWEGKVEISLAVSYQSKHTFTIRPRNLTLDIYPIEMKTYVYIKTCIQMFTASLCIIIKTWKQPKSLHLSYGYSGTPLSKE